MSLAKETVVQDADRDDIGTTVGAKVSSELSVHLPELRKGHQDPILFSTMQRAFCAVKQSVHTRADSLQRAVGSGIRSVHARMDGREERLVGFM